MLDRILEGLNDSQRAAVTATRGPVCILAGAGTGKTTTITKRIAYQVASGAFRPEQLLAVTFTDRAANEMRERLSKLGIARVRAKTFHAEALAQVAAYSGGEPPRLLDSKAQLISGIVRRLPAPFKFKATKDVAGEIERAKNRRVDPSGYLDDVEGTHEPPLPPDVMARVYGEYESRKRRAGRIDFEDLLELCIRYVTGNPDAANRVRDRYAAFTVDEYQDVNLLQQTLLDGWLQGRDEVCVVGDDYQSIFGFTGATPSYLLGFPSRYPGAAVVALEDNYRSTAQVLELANRLAPGLEGRPKTLRSTRPDGPQPVLVEHATGQDEVGRIVERVRALHAGGAALEDMAILYRINARSEDFEEAFTAAGIAFQVRDSSFLRRPGPRGVLAQASRARVDTPALTAVERAAREVGWTPDGEADTEEEANRLADIDRLVRLAENEPPETTVASFVSDLQARFGNRSQGRGVVMSTYHRAKGLEFEAVFLPRLEDRELPFALSRSDADVAEERRLLYVGLTRAKVHLTVSWVRTRDGKTVRPSRFVQELVPRGVRPARAAAPAAASQDAPADPDLFARLRAWRSRTAVDAGVPAYVIFHDATLKEICARRPSSLVDLGRIAGIGPTKLARYGSDVLDVCRE